MPIPGPVRAGRRPELTETVDPVAGTLRVSGHLTAQGVDLLRGTVETLCRLGHTRVLLDMAAVHTADDGALPLLHTLGQDVAGSGGSVVLLGLG